MDIETARTVLENIKAAPRPDWDFFPAAAYIVGFDSLGDEGRKGEFVEAALTLLAHGEESEQSLVATILTKVTLTSANKEQIRGLFFTHSDNQVLISLVREVAFPFHPYATDRIEIRKLFLADPVRYWRLADVIGLPWDDDVLAALARGARETRDGRILATMFDGAQWMRSASDFVPILREVDPAILRAALPHLGEDLKPVVAEILTPSSQ